MKAIKGIKDSMLSIVLALAGIMSVAAVHFRHTARAAKDKVKRINHARQVEKAQMAAINKAAQELREREDAIQGDKFNPAVDFNDNDK